jgi:hypothetical protein
VAGVGGGNAALSCKAEAGEARGGTRWQRERGKTDGVWAGSGKEKKWVRPKGIVNFLIYSKRFQTSMNCFDQKVDLPSSKNFKLNMYLKGIKQGTTFLIGFFFQNSK